MKFLYNKKFSYIFLGCAIFNGINLFCYENPMDQQIFKEKHIKKTKANSRIMISFKNLNEKKRATLAIGIIAGAFAGYALYKKGFLFPFLFLGKKNSDTENKQNDTIFTKDSAQKLSKDLFIYGAEGIARAFGIGYILTNESIRKKINGFEVKKGIRGLPVRFLKKCTYNGWTIVRIEAFGGIAKIAAGLAMITCPEETAVLLNTANKKMGKIEKRFGHEDKLESLSSF